MSTSSSHTDLSRMEASRDRAGQGSLTPVGGAQELSCPIFVLDPGGIVQVWNGTMESLTGVSEREALGHSLSDWFTPASVEALEALAAGEAATPVTEVVLLGAEGARVGFQCAAKVMAPAQGGIGGLLVVGVATPTVRTQDQAWAGESLDRVVSGVVHSFNNILTVLTCNLALMSTHQTAESDSDLGQLISEAQRAGDEAVALIESLADLTRPSEEVGAGSDVGEVLAETAARFTHELPEGVELRVAPASGPRVAIAAEDLLDILRRLIENASEAMEDGGTIEVQAEPSAARSDCTVVTVTDGGHGFDAANEHLLVEPFFTTKRPARGAGLGLARVYMLARRAGGELTIRSSASGRTVVCVELPNTPESANTEGPWS